MVFLILQYLGVKSNPQKTSPKVSSQPPMVLWKKITIGIVFGGVSLAMIGGIYFANLQLLYRFFHVYSSKMYCYAVILTAVETMIAGYLLNLLAQIPRKLQSGSPSPFRQAVMV